MSSDQIGYHQQILARGKKEDHLYPSSSQRRDSMESDYIFMYLTRPGTNRSTGDQIATDDPKHKSIFGDPVFRRETAITDLEANTNLESSIDNTALRIDTIRITRYQHYHTYPHTRSELLP
jgi:hypothetical protein